MKVLITSGATREPIDQIRFITNFSSGTTGAKLADEFISQGAEVTYFCGIDATRPRSPCEAIEFSSFASLDRTLRDFMGRIAFDAVIHLAAVGDYSVAAIESDGRSLDPSSLKKIDSSGELLLRLKPNFKIIEQLASYAVRKKPMLVAFKLTHTVSEVARAEAVSKLFRTPDLDLVVHNDYSEIERGVRRFTIFEKSVPVATCMGPEKLGQSLFAFVRRYCDSHA